jgi:hypothetical protein
MEIVKQKAFYTNGVGVSEIDDKKLTKCIAVLLSVGTIGAMVNIFAAIIWG